MQNATKEQEKKLEELDINIKMSENNQQQDPNNQQQQQEEEMPEEIEITISTTKQSTTISTTK